MVAAEGDNGLIENFMILLTSIPLMSLVSSLSFRSVITVSFEDIECPAEILQKAGLATEA